MGTIVQYTISSIPTEAGAVNPAQLSGTFVVEYYASTYTYQNGVLYANGAPAENSNYEPKVLAYNLTATNADFTGGTVTSAGSYTDVGTTFYEMRIGSSSGNPASNTFFFQANSVDGSYYGVSYTDVLLNGTQTSAYTAQSGQNFFFNFPSSYYGTIYAGVTESVPMTAQAGYVDADGDFAACFTPDTLISTPTGSTQVRNLAIGDLILNHAGQSLPVKWIGTQRIHPAFIGDSLPICISAGAMGNGLPLRDLYVSPHHAMYIDHCLLIEAKALINGTNITQVTQWEGDIVYLHIETEHHEIILAEGAPAETFMDNVSRARFNNYSEYKALYPEAHEMIELEIPRVSHRRQLPNAVKAKLEAISEGLICEVKVQMAG